MQRLNSLTKERRYVNARELEAITGLTRETWSRYRLLGGGPPFYRLGARGSRPSVILYDLAEVEQWIKRRGSERIGAT